MRLLIRFSAVAVLAASLALGVVQATSAAPSPVSRPAPRFVTKPRIATPVVAIRTVFDATGSVVPTITADDTRTAVNVAIMKVGVRGRMALVSVVPAELTGPVGAGTGYVAHIALNKAGQYALIARVTIDGRVRFHSAPRPVKAVLPYKVSKPRVARPVVRALAVFEASGTLTPALAVDDTTTVVAISVQRMGAHGRFAQVASVATTLTPGSAMTSYVASLSLPAAGNYRLIAIAKNGELLIGQSEPRPMIALPKPGRRTR